MHIVVNYFCRYIRNKLNNFWNLKKGRVSKLTQFSCHLVVRDVDQSSLVVSTTLVPEKDGPRLHDEMAPLVWTWIWLHSSTESANPVPWIFVSTFFFYLTRWIYDDLNRILEKNRSEHNKMLTRLQGNCLFTLWPK